MLGEINVSLDLGGLGALIASLVSVFLVTRTRHEVKDGNLLTAQVDRAVNGKVKGEASIQSQVTALYDERFPQKNADAVLPTLSRIETLLREQAEREDG